MNDEGAVIGYILVRAGAKPKSSTAHKDRLAILRQRRAMEARCTVLNLKVAKLVFDVTSYAGGNFTRRPHFQRALEFARDTSGVLMVYDLIDLLRRIKPVELSATFNHLRTLDVDIIDALSSLRCRELTTATLLPLLQGAVMESQLIGAAIKRGRTNSSPAPVPAATRAAAKFRSMRANQDAELLAPRIRAFEQRLPDGQALTPAALARILNEAKVPAPRGGEWHRNSATRLLQRHQQASVRRPKADAPQESSESRNRAENDTEE